MKHRIAAGVALCAALACGSPSPEELIEDATDQVRRAEAELELAREALEREEQELEQARAELETAREALGGAEQRLAEARDRVAEVADDAYLFRAVQSALLAADSLEEQAVAARVRDGVVTLEGVVPESEQKERAEALAAAVPGVKKVVNQVRVEQVTP